MSLGAPASIRVNSVQPTWSTSVDRMIPNDEFWKETFARVVLTPHTWLGKATELLHCANLVLEKSAAGPLKGTYENIGVFMMLSAFAFENMLKALILAKKPATSQSWLFSTHRLSKLAQEAGLKCNEQAENLLLRLENFAVQSGRYPVPRDWKQYKAQTDGAGEQRRPVFLSGDLDQIFSLVHGIEAEFKSVGVTCDLYDRSYTATSLGKPKFVERRINPHRSP